MTVARGASHRLLAIILVFMLAAPLPVRSATAPLGTARGFGGAKLSVDANKSWLPIGARSFPILEGTTLRSAAGSAVLDLTDGSRVDVFPFTAVSFEEQGPVTRISILYGRLAFRLEAQTRVEILTPAARLEPVRRGLMVGEVFVNGSGLMGLKMAEGSLQVTQVGAAQRVLLASRDPVFLPKPPGVHAFFLNSDTPRATPPGAKAIFAPNGRSVGYITRPDSFAIYPGFTADLTRPFPSQLVRLAMAKIPPADLASDAAMPLFDVDGHSVGYISGPEFYAQQEEGPEAPTPPEGVKGQPEKVPQGPPPEEQKEEKKRGIGAWVIGGGLAAALVIGGAAALGGGGGHGGGGGGGPTPTPPPSTMTTPK